MESQASSEGIVGVRRRIGEQRKRKGEGGWGYRPTASEGGWKRPRSFQRFPSEPAPSAKRELEAGAPPRASRGFLAFEAGRWAG